MKRIGFVTFQVRHERQRRGVHQEVITTVINNNHKQNKLNRYITTLINNKHKLNKTTKVINKKHKLNKQTLNKLATHKH